ncbi:DUF2948 family protein [Rhodovulum sulfidophilum]|uniref:DUF2948 family protein n=1 Tax=Rhodovulum sulfidophilum TaxID=35806 RepID=UPI001922837F|nr:DUF2948 family protein [Rhodovulum sulfidophilum]MBL3565104.1 DUF2948 family protein [Rhodovulum sulfidophilum]
MTEDARFEDGAEAPLHLMAVTEADLEVISTLAQDAVLPATEMRWDRPRRRFAALVNRFRWEDRDAAERRGRPFERVQAVLTVEDVTHVASQGIDRTDRDLVLSLLSVSFEPGADGTGRVVLTLAGDGAVALDVECLEVTLTDVTRPYAAPSGKAPRHS